MLLLASHFFLSSFATPSTIFSLESSPTIPHASKSLSGSSSERTQLKKVNPRVIAVSTHLELDGNWRDRTGPVIVVVFTSGGALHDLTCGR